ncbi:hypothetical protein GPECTOR_13g709 [Gonium pectorale]|uniref:Uncharacterized protein n=1 Tax=Gonium pectorale TaxID=33097 RepID=A0A150GNC1_GONPE|nr:hypothetical protein GPECTOR_13g709 [Gonium pectorale]|eukprot:KXZ51222.1 hypothetical protein GPECTOR_13g709 [Gonium pectorale]
MLFSRPAPAPAPASPPPVAPLQPCLQFVLTSHVVALCCAVDGDRQSYGLPAVLGGSDPPSHPAAAASAASWSWSDAVPAASAALPLFTPDGRPFTRHWQLRQEPPPGQQQPPPPAGSEGPTSGCVGGSGSGAVGAATAGVGAATAGVGAATAGVSSGTLSTTRASGRCTEAVGTQLALAALAVWTRGSPAPAPLSLTDVVNTLQDAMQALTVAIAQGGADVAAALPATAAAASQAAVTAAVTAEMLAAADVQAAVPPVAAAMAATPAAQGPGAATSGGHQAAAEDVTTATPDAEAGLRANSATRGETAEAAVVGAATVVAPFPGGAASASSSTASSVAAAGAAGAASPPPALVRTRPPAGGEMETAPPGRAANEAAPGHAEVTQCDNQVALSAALQPLGGGAEVACGSLPQVASEASEAHEAHGALGGATAAGRPAVGHSPVAAAALMTTAAAAACPSPQPGAADGERDVRPGETGLEAVGHPGVAAEPLGLSPRGAAAAMPGAAAGAGTDTASSDGGGSGSGGTAGALVSQPAPASLLPPSSSPPAPTPPAPPQLEPQAPLPHAPPQQHANPGLEREAPAAPIPIWQVFETLCGVRRGQREIDRALAAVFVDIAECTAQSDGLVRQLCATEQTQLRLDGDPRNRGSAAASRLEGFRAGTDSSWAALEGLRARLNAAHARVTTSRRQAEQAVVVQPVLDAFFGRMCVPGNHRAVHVLCIRLARAALRAWDPHSIAPLGTAAVPAPPEVAGPPALAEEDAAAAAALSMAAQGAAAVPAAELARTGLVDGPLPGGGASAGSGGCGAASGGVAVHLDELSGAAMSAPAGMSEAAATADPAELSVSTPPVAILPPSEAPPLLHAALRCARAVGLAATAQQAQAVGAPHAVAAAVAPSERRSGSASLRRGLAARRAEWWCLALHAAEASAAAIQSPWADDIRSDLLAWVYECLVGADCDARDSGAAGGRGGGGGSGGVEGGGGGSGGVEGGGGQDGGAGAGEGPSTSCRHVPAPTPPAPAAPPALPFTPRPDVVAAHSAGWLPAVTRLMWRAKEQLGAAASSGAVAGQAASQSSSAAASSTTTSAGASTASAASAGVGYAAASTAAPSQPLHLPIAVLRPRVMEGWPLAWAEALAFAPSREDAAALLEAAAELLEAAVAVVQAADAVAAGAGPGATETGREAPTAAALLSLEWLQLRTAVAAVRPLLSVVPDFPCWRSGELLTPAAAAVTAASVGFDGAKAADATPGADASGGRGSALPPEGPLAAEAGAGAEEAEVEARCVPGPGDVSTIGSGCSGSAGTVSAQQAAVTGDGSDDRAGGSLADPTAPLPPSQPPPASTVCSSPPAAATAPGGGLREGARHTAPASAAPAAAASQLAWLIDHAASRLRPAFDRAVLTLASAPRAG